jgi:hypothetical protein
MYENMHESEAYTHCYIETLTALEIHMEVEYFPLLSRGQVQIVPVTSIGNEVNKRECNVGIWPRCDSELLPLAWSEPVVSVRQLAIGNL